MYKRGNQKVVMVEGVKGIKILFCLSQQSGEVCVMHWLGVGKGSLAGSE